MNYINLFSTFVVSVCQSVREFVDSVNRWVARQHSSSFSRERSRGLVIESLESRELLAANILDLGVYASPSDPAVVTFDLSTYGNEAMVFDVTAQSGGTFDPGTISIFGSNGQVLPLSQISTDSATTTTGRFSLSGGTYTIKVASDNGTLGNFNISLAVADDVADNKITYDPMLKDLIAITLAQKTHINWYDYLTNAYPHLITKYGVNAFKGDLLKQFPEMDMNGNGVVDSNDKELAIAVANSVNNGNSVEMPLKAATIKTTPKTTTPSIVDTDGPAITIALQNDTGSSQNDKLTTDPTLNVTITDPRTVKRVQVLADDGQTFVSVPVSESDNYTFTADYLKTLFNVNDLVGTYTFIVKATDGFDNVSSSSFTFTVAPPIVGTDEQPSPISNSTESVTINVFEQPSFATGAAITQVNGINVVSGRVELDKGYVIVSGNTVAFYTDGKFLTLNKLQTKYVTLNFTVTDNAGNSIAVEKTVTINGSNQKPELVDDKTVVAAVDEGCSVDITFDDLLGMWIDNDSEILTPVNFVVDSVVNSPANLEAVFTADVLSEFVTSDGSKLTFDATDNVFSQLAVGESVVVRLKYNVSDGELESGTFGYIDITINGVNQSPTVTQDTFAANRFTTEEQITFGHDELLEKYGVIDGDVSDSGKHFIQSIVSDEMNPNGINLHVNYEQDGKVVDVTISASDELRKTLRLNKNVTGSFLVTISDGNGGTVKTVLLVEITGVVDKLEVTYNSESSWFVDTCEGDKATLNELDEDAPDFTLLLPSNVTGKPKIMIANLFSVAGISTDDNVKYSMNSENKFLTIDNDGNLFVDYSQLDGTDIPYVQTVTATINDDETVEFTFLVNFETVEIANVDDELVIDLNGDESDTGLPHKIVQTPDAKSGEFAVVDGSSELVITSINDNEKTYDELLPTFEEGVDYKLEVDADGFVSLTWLNLDKFKFLPEGVVAELDLSFTLRSGEFEYEHSVTFTINGVNDVPVISDIPENLELEINGKAIDSNIELGQLTITDADGDIVETKPAQVFCTDETSGEPAEIDATAFVDVDGKIYINFAALPVIEPGHSLDCWFTVTFDDGKTNGTTSETIRVKLTSAPAPNVEIINPEIVEFNETTKPKNVVFDIEVSDASSDERTGNEWYKIENGVVEVVRGDSGYEFTDAFNTSKDSFFTFESTEFGQQLRFKVTNANIFNFLNDGETLTLTYTFDVTDIAKEVTITKSVTITIHGENTLPTYNDKNIGNHDTSIAENDSVTLDVLSIWADADSAHTKKVFDIVGADGTGLPVVTVKSVNNTNAFNVGDVIDGLITITTKANGVKQITFTSGTTFDALAVDATVELEITYKVADSVAVSEKNGVVILTINGTNDEPTISVGKLNDVSWTGRKQGDTVIVGSFDTNDIDGDELTTEVVEGTTEVWNGEEWVAIDDVEFTIVDNEINITFINKLELSNGESAKYRFKLQTFDGIATTVAEDYAEVKVTTLFNPSVDDIDVTVNESDTKVSKTIDITDKNDSGHEFLINNLDDTGITYSNDELYKNVNVDLVDCFSIENGTFTFDAGDKFVFLNDGDSVTITFTYTVTDKVYEELTTTGTITVTINGANSAPVYVAPIEHVAIPEVDADEDAIELSPLANWTDPDLSQNENKDDWSVVSPNEDDKFTAVIVGRSESMNESAAFDDEFVNGTIYSDLVMFVDGKLVFIPDNVFVGLRAGDYVDLEISYRVVDAGGAVSDEVRTERVRVNGVNEQMSVEVINDTFNVSTSVTNAESLQVLPAEFIISDDDIGEVVTFEIKEVTEVTGTGLEYWDGLTDEVKDSLFAIDSSTGKVTIDVSLLEDLPAGNDLTFTLKVNASNTSGDTLDNTLTIIVTSPNPPEVISGEESATESEAATEIRINLNELVSDTNSPSRTGNDWYSITGVEASVDGFDITGKWSFDSSTNEIVLNTDDTFASLAKDESAVITFKFTVNDNYYDRSTDSETTLIITGENNAPTQLNENEIDFGTTTVGGESCIIKISNYFTDIDNGDHIRVTAINGYPLDDGKVTIPNVGKFVYDEEKGTLSYADDYSDFFWNISVNFPETINFTITVADEQDAELTADAAVTVHGVNARPIVKIPSYEIDDANIIEINAKDIASDRNIGDTLTFVRIGSVEVTPSTQIKAESNITITFSDDLTKMYFNRSFLLDMDYQETLEGARVIGTYESLMLSIVVQDDSEEENAVSDLGNITFVIKGVGSEVGGDDNLGDNDEPEIENGETLLLDSIPTDKQKSDVIDKENQSFDKELDPDGKKQTVGQIEVDGSADSYTYERVTGSFTLGGVKITNPGFTINADGTITIAKGKLGNFVDGEYQFAVIITAEDGTSYRVNVTVNITVIQTATDQALALFALYDDLFHVDYSDELKKNNKETADSKSGDEDVIDKVFAEFYDEQLRNTA